MSGNTYSWVLDSIGNRISETTNSVTHSYTANQLNQYTQITNGGLKTLSYDLDGNLLTDGMWTNTWNAENKMICAQPVSPTSGSGKIEISYDYMGRRFKEIISTYNGSTWSVTQTNLWVYDGWNPVSEICNLQYGITTQSYVHGLDLSGSLQGAGGIGGLLSWTRSSDTNTFYYFADGNGNVTELVNTNGTVVVHYEWDAYGNSIAMTGAEAENNVFRYSSKYYISLLKSLSVRLDK